MTTAATIAPARAPQGWRAGETASRRIAQTPRGASSYDAESHTVEAVLATGYRVRRWYGEEELAIREDAIDLLRVALQQVHFLDHHNQYERAAVLGTVIAARIDNGQLIGTIRFHDTEQGRAAEADAAQGHMRGVSVGYRINKLQLVERNDDTDESVYRAERWELLEVSSVSVPADPTAQVRSLAPPLNSKEITTMETPTTTAAPAAPVPQPRAPADRAQVDAEIRSLGALSQIGDAFTSDLIARGLSVDQARRDILDELHVRSTRGVGTGATGTGRPSGDDPSVIVDRMSEALAHRMQPTAPLSDAARPYANLRLVDCARTLLQSRGERIASWASPDSILSRALGGGHTTSDFPGLLTMTGNRVLLTAYEAAQSPLKLLSRRTTITDFRAKTSLRLGALGRLEKVNESGEVTHTTRGEAKEAYSLSTFARLFTLTRQALINDDLAAFSDFNVAAGQAAAETEASELCALLTANAGAGVTMDDSKALFHTDHGNLAGSGAAIDVTTLSAARLAMRSQVGLAGEPINVTPTYLLTGAALETAAEQVLATLYAATVAEANPFSGRLTLLVEPRLSGNQWLVFADPARAAVLEHAYLTASPGPQIATRDGWEVLGVEFRVLLDFGCGALDWRGAYRNAGAGG